MYNVNQVISGLAKFIDTEIVSKITGWQKWIIGAGLGLSLEKATNIFNSLKSNEMIKALDIIDKNDKINVDVLYKHIKNQAQKGAITFDLPFVGVMTLNEYDIDKLYNCIRDIS